MLRTRSSKLKVTRFRVKGPDCICCRPGTKMKESASHHINEIIDKDAPEDICRNIMRQHKEIRYFEPCSRLHVVGLGWFWNVSNFSSWCVFWQLCLSERLPEAPWNHLWSSWSILGFSKFSIKLTFWTSFLTRLGPRRTLIESSGHGVDIYWNFNVIWR